MVGERESSQVQWGAVSAAPQVAPCAVNRCPSNALTCLQQGLFLGGDTDYGSILGDDYRAQSVWQQGRAFNQPVLLQVHHLLPPLPSIFQSCFSATLP